MWLQGWGGGEVEGEGKGRRDDVKGREKVKGSGGGRRQR